MSEKRFLSAATQAPTIVRAEGQPPKVVGYGAVYHREDNPGTQYQLWDGAVERIIPGAFDQSVRGGDVRSTFNHNPDIVLGRKSSGTLELSLDELGLRYEVTPPDTQMIRDQVLAPLERGDVSGSSIMFIPRDAVWRTEVTPNGRLAVRELRQVDLMELGPVTFPAYTATEAGVRTLQEELRALVGEAGEAPLDESIVRRLNAVQEDLDAMRMRLDLLWRVAGAGSRG